MSNCVWVRDLSAKGFGGCTFAVGIVFDEEYHPLKSLSVFLCVCVCVCDQECHPLKLPVVSVCVTTNMSAKITCSCLWLCVCPCWCLWYLWIGDLEPASLLWRHWSSKMLQQTLLNWSVKLIPVNLKVIVASLYFHEELGWWLEDCYLEAGAQSSSLIRLGLLAVSMAVDPSYDYVGAHYCVLVKTSLKIGTAIT